MITTEMLRVCAEKVGETDIIVHEDRYGGSGCRVIGVVTVGKNKIKYHPATNAEQDRMLDDWLLKEDWSTYSYSPMQHAVQNLRTHAVFNFHCPRNEFRTRAVWEVSK